HFFAVSANVMRRILIDEARARRAERRGGGNLTRAPGGGVGVGGGGDVDLIAPRPALPGGSQINRPPSQGGWVRYFCGLSCAETAEVLKVSADTVMRDWRFAKAWLKRELVRGSTA